MQWDNATVPMHDVENFNNENIDDFERDLFYVHDPDTTDAEHIQRIVEQKYTKTDLPKFVSDMVNLTEDEQEEVLKLLKKHESLFDGTLETWKKNQCHWNYYQIQYPTMQNCIQYHNPKNRNLGRKWKDEWNGAF